MRFETGRARRLRPVLTGHTLMVGDLGRTELAGNKPRLVGTGPIGNEK